MGLCKILGNFDKFYLVLVKEVYILIEQEVNIKFLFPFFGYRIYWWKHP